MYRDFNDYELLYLVSENNEDGFNILYKKYMPLIIKFANRYMNSFKYLGYEKDDLLQIGYITLFKASRYYKEYSDSMFYTFLYTLLENIYNEEYRKCNSNKYRSLNKSISYDLKIPGKDLSYKEVLGEDNLYYEEYDCYKRIITIKNNLPFDVACYVELKYNGYNNKEISELLDIDPKKINTFRRIIKENYLYT
jgi:RNA polymerase sigma factor (sigma-70 family)